MMARGSDILENANKKTSTVHIARQVWATERFCYQIWALRFNLKCSALRNCITFTENDNPDPASQGSNLRSRDSSFDIATRLLVGRPISSGSSLYRQNIFVFSIIYRTVLGPTQPLMPCGRGLKLTTHLHLVPGLRMVDLHFHSPISLHDAMLN
jgi:hypothetical protein